MQETQVQSLGWEDPLEEVKGNPLKYPCLENSLDKGAWWATVQKGLQSWTRLCDPACTDTVLHSDCTNLHSHRACHVLSKVSQTENQKSHMTSLICGV